MARRLLVPVLAGLALVAALPAAAVRSAAPTIAMTVCKDVVLATGASGKYWKCTGVYSLGVPHTSKQFALLLSNHGFPKGAKFQLRFLDNKSNKELTTPITFGPISYDPGLWRLGFPGPFPANLRMKVQPVYNGKPIQTAAIISFT